MSAHQFMFRDIQLMMMVSPHFALPFWPLGVKQKKNEVGIGVCSS